MVWRYDFHYSFPIVALVVDDVVYMPECRGYLAPGQRQKFTALLIMNSINDSYELHFQWQQYLPVQIWHCFSLVRGNRLNNGSR